MKRWKILGLIGLAVVFIAGAGYLGLRIGAPQRETKPTAAPITVAVTKGDVRQTVSAPGELLWTEIIYQYMDAGGQITEISVRPGDWVEAGDALILIDDADAQVAVDRAEIDLRLAELSLEELTQEVDPADLAAAQARLAAAQADLTRLTSPPDKQDLRAARESLKSAEETLDELLAGPSADEIDIAEADLNLAQVAVRQAQAEYDKVKARPDIGSLPEAVALQQATIAYKKAKAAYDLAVAGAGEDQIAGARAGVAQARARLDALSEDPDPDAVTAAEAWVAQAQAQLEDLLAGASASDLERAELNVARAQLNLDTAREELENTVLLAPAGGVILDVPVSQGQTVNKGTSAVRMADPAALELYATVIEEDYTVTEADLLVDVFFDAMPERTVLGRIVRIVPEKLPGDRPLYAIYVELEEVPDGMAEGMTADAEIIIDSREDVVRLPRGLVKARSDGSAEIELWRNNQEVNRTIQTGLRGDVYIEILDGLQEGDLVIGR